jgi:hypothetical protein
LENLPSGAYASACSSHRAQAQVPEFFSHAASMSRIARHAPAAARHLIHAPIYGPKQPSPPLRATPRRLLPPAPVARHQSEATAGSSLQAPVHAVVHLKLHMELPFPASPFPFLGRRSPATLRRRNCNILATPPPRRRRTIPGHSQNEPRPRFPPQLKLKLSSSPTGELASMFLLRCQALPPSPPPVSRTPPGHSATQPSPSGSLFLLRMS